MVTLDGRRIAIAKAPASLTAGEQFMQTVFRMDANTAAQEKAKPGSSTLEGALLLRRPQGWRCRRGHRRGPPRQDPDRVLIESPRTPSTTCPSSPTRATWRCRRTGTRRPPRAPARAARTPPPGASRCRSARPPPCGPKLKAPLKGNVWGSVYRASDVKITGPLPGTHAVANRVHGRRHADGGQPALPRRQGPAGRSVPDPRVHGHRRQRRPARSGARHRRPHDHPHRGIHPQLRPPARDRGVRHRAPTGCPLTFPGPGPL